MNRSILALLVFLAVLLGLVVSTHWFLWQRLVVATHLRAPWRQLASGLLVILGASLPLGFLLGRRVDAPWGRAWALVAFTWMGVAFLLLMGLFVAELLHLGHRGWQKFAGAADDPSRRLFLARLLGGAASAGALLGGSAGLHQALRQPPLREVEVRLRRLPRELDGFTIVQISDLHVGPTIRKEPVEELVRRINQLQPDLVALTGDLVDGTVDTLREHVAPLGQIASKHGTFLCTGNHEYFSGADEWLAEFTRLGVRPLRNERVSIGSGPATFDLAGVDDWTAARFQPGHGHDLRRAMQGCDPSRECVLLAHQPKAIEEAAALGVGLQLSGHTHGGQIWPFGWLVRLVQPYVAGLHQHGETFIYVSRGTGFWGPPMRLAAPSELTRITLRAGA